MIIIQICILDCNLSAAQQVKYFYCITSMIIDMTSLRNINSDGGNGLNDGGSVSGGASIISHFK